MNVVARSSPAHQVVQNPQRRIATKRTIEDFESWRGAAMGAAARSLEASEVGTAAWRRDRAILHRGWLA